MQSKVTDRPPPAYTWVKRVEVAGERSVYFMVSELKVPHIDWRNPWLIGGLIILIVLIIIVLIIIALVK